MVRQWMTRTIDTRPAIIVATGSSRIVKPVDPAITSDA
jgi:hypothetical protein